jgi:hypothetical protein
MYINEIDVENLGPIEKANIKFALKKVELLSLLCWLERMVLVNQL